MSAAFTPTVTAIAAARESGRLALSDDLAAAGLAHLREVNENDLRDSATLARDPATEAFLAVCHARPSTTGRECAATSIVAALEVLATFSAGDPDAEGDLSEVRAHLKRALFVTERLEAVARVALLAEEAGLVAVSPGASFVRWTGVRAGHVGPGWVAESGDL
jgi:hypothetical protein